MRLNIGFNDVIALFSILFFFSCPSLPLCKLGLEKSLTVSYAVIYVESFSEELKRHVFEISNSEYQIRR